MIHTRAMCVHCGIPIVNQAFEHWCRHCVEEARHNRGVCSFCSHEVAEFSACWQIRRRLELALAKQQMPDALCPSCLLHNNEHVEMDVRVQTSSGSTRHINMVCPVCQTATNISTRTYMPPPRSGGAAK